MSTAKVSIIIPCFNAEKYIGETIESILMQTYTNWECIIINDGSTDRSADIVKKYVDKNSKLRYIYQDNAGVCAARNHAINVSDGEYVLCIDGDDLISKNFLEETVKLLDIDRSLTIATSAVKFFGRSNGTLKVVSYDLDVLLAENQLVITSLFRRSDFDRVGGFNLNMKEGFEDWDFWISLLKKNGQVSCATNATFYYRLLNASRNKDITYEKEQRLRYQIWENHKELFSQYFVNPIRFFEYGRVANSPEYKIGRIILHPIRQLKYLINTLRSNFYLINLKRNKQ